jgi:hypothetical protein
VDLERVGDLSDGLTFLNQPARQFCLFRVQLSRASEMNPSPSGCLAARAGTFPDQVAFEFGYASDHGHDQLAGVSCGISPGFG